MNITIDGFCDHTAGIADEELHEHYRKVLLNAGAALYGRTTFELMKYWKELVENPSGEKSMDEFAAAMHNIPKIVFSHTLKDPDWNTATIANRSLEDEVLALRENPGKDVLVGSPGLIDQLTQLGLIDEYQLCIHPVIIGKGLPLFKNVSDKIILSLVDKKTFASGATVMYYQPKK